MSEISKVEHTKYKYLNSLATSDNLIKDIVSLFWGERLVKTADLQAQKVLFICQ